MRNPKNKTVHTRCENLQDKTEYTHVRNLNSANDKLNDKHMPDTFDTFETKQNTHL